MKLDTRQKILIPLIILAFIFIVWQIYDLFFARKDVTAPVPVANKHVITPIAPGAEQAGPADAAPATPEVGAPEKRGIEALPSTFTDEQSTQHMQLMKEYLRAFGFVYALFLATRCLLLV